VAGTVRTLSIFLVRAAVTATVFWILFRYYGLRQVLEHIDRLDLGWLMAGLVVAVVQVFVLAWRWQLFCRALTNAAPQFSAVLSGVGRSMLIGQLLPTTVGTDAIRATALARAAGTAGAVRSVVCDRLLGLLALGLMVGAELPFFIWKTRHATATGSLALAVLALVGGFILMFGLRRWVTRLPIVGRPMAVIVGDLLQALTHRHGRRGFILGFAAHALAALVFVALIRSVEPQAPLSVAALVILPALLVIAVPISIGGWGVREAAIASGFALLGADSTQAVTASILFGLSGPVSGAVVELLGLFGLADLGFHRQADRRP
jgi:glycosyltransferase 2 family protein